MTMISRLSAAVGVMVAFASPVAAQQSVSEVLGFLVTNQSVETGSVERDRNAAQATSDTISRALLANLATLPVTTSSGGFVYRLNPELGTLERASPGFGPFFVERALTAGRGAASLGLTFQHLRFTTLDGHNLRDGSLITTANQFEDESEPFDVDQLTLNIDAEIATLHGNIGLGERMELGAAVPFVLLRLRGARVNNYRGTAFTQATASATAVGLADAIVRTKITLVQTATSGFAAALDARLPTGREEDLLGTGALSLRVSGVGSFERGRISTHANGGVLFGGLARELSFGGAVAVAAASRLTLTTEVLGRWMDSPGHIAPVTAPHPGLIGVNTIRLVPGRTGLTLVTMAPGFKWNVAETWVLVANVSLPLTSSGLTSAVTPFVGIDYAVDW